MELPISLYVQRQNKEFFWEDTETPKNSLAIARMDGKGWLAFETCWDGQRHDQFMWNASSMKKTQRETFIPYLN